MKTMMQQPVKNRDSAQAHMYEFVSAMLQELNSCQAILRCQHTGSTELALSHSYDIACDISKETPVQWLIKHAKFITFDHRLRIDLKPTHSSIISARIVMSQLEKDGTGVHSEYRMALVDSEESYDALSYHDKCWTARAYTYINSQKNGRERVIAERVVYASQSVLNAVINTFHSSFPRSHA